MLRQLKHWLLPHSSRVRALLSQDWRQAKLLAIDLELTGLNPKQDEIVSIGWQIIQRQQLAIGQSGYSICKASADSPHNLAQSPCIHGITESQLQTGRDTQQLLRKIAPLARNHILAFHNADMDMAFLLRYLRSFQLYDQPIVTLDTLKLQRYLLEKNSHVIKGNSATLAANRHYFKLPDANAHHALDDAFATAELLLAQLHRLSAGQAMAIKDLQHTGAIQIWR